MEDLTGGVFVLLLDDGDELMWNITVIQHSPNNTSVNVAQRPFKS
jgi:hypothetical protein